MVTDFPKQVSVQESLVVSFHSGLEDLVHFLSQIWLLPFLPEQCGHYSSNLRSYPPSLYLDAGKEGMIHLLVGSYVQKQDSVFSMIDRETIIMVCCLLISCHISTRLSARSWSENRMVQTKRVFARTSFLLC